MKDTVRGRHSSYLEKVKRGRGSDKDAPNQAYECPGFPLHPNFSDDLIRN